MRPRLHLAATGAAGMILGTALLVPVDSPQQMLRLGGTLAAGSGCLVLAACGCLGLYRSTLTAALALDDVLPDELPYDPQPLGMQLRPRHATPPVLEDVRVPVPGPWRPDAAATAGEMAALAAAFNGGRAPDAVRPPVRDGRTAELPAVGGDPDPEDWWAAVTGRQEAAR